MGAARGCGESSRRDAQVPPSRCARRGDTGRGDGPGGLLRWGLCRPLLSCPSAVSLALQPTYTFKIPEVHFPLLAQCVQVFYEDCVAQLSKAMVSLAPENSVLLARYFYLRGLVQLMQGRLLGALLDFQSLYKTDVHIFPADLVQRTVESLSGPERTQAERMPELRRLISEVMDKPVDAPKADDRVKNFELPKTHLQLDDFVKRVQESGVVKDTGVIHRLFEALTVGTRTRAGGGRQALEGKSTSGGWALPAPWLGRTGGWLSLCADGPGSLMGSVLSRPRGSTHCVVAPPTWGPQAPVGMFQTHSSPERAWPVPGSPAPQLSHVYCGCLVGPAPLPLPSPPEERVQTGPFLPDGGWHVFATCGCVT